MLLGLIDRGHARSRCGAKWSRSRETVRWSKFATCSSGSFPKRSESSGWVTWSTERRSWLLPGDAARGRLIFTTNSAAQCKSCHKAGDVGENVGPDLTKIGTKYDKAALLDQILEPSKTIEPQYTTYMLEPRTGGS